MTHTPVRALPHEIAAALPGDELLPGAQVVMDRGFTLYAEPATVWPWLVQLGKDRAGWYLPRSIERIVPARRRALRRIDPALQRHEVGDVIPDWGAADATFELVALTAPALLLYRSTRGRMQLTWAITLRPLEQNATRVQLRLRLTGVRHPRLASTGGGVIDLLTVAGLAAGLRERVQADPRRGA